MLVFLGVDCFFFQPANSLVVYQIEFKTVQGCQLLRAHKLHEEKQIWILAKLFAYWRDPLLVTQELDWDRSSIPQTHRTNPEKFSVHRKFLLKRPNRGCGIKQPYKNLIQVNCLRNPHLRILQQPLTCCAPTQWRRTGSWWRWCCSPPSSPSRRRASAERRSCTGWPNRILHMKLKSIYAIYIIFY